MINRINTTPRASKLVISGGRVETSGLVANDCKASITGQTQDVLSQLDGLLASAGVGREGLLRIQIWLSDIQDFEAMNEVYDAWLGGQHQPARACVGAQLASPDYRIEIQAWAQLNEQTPGLSENSTFQWESAMTSNSNLSVDLAGRQLITSSSTLWKPVEVAGSVLEGVFMHDLVAAPEQWCSYWMHMKPGTHTVLHRHSSTEMLVVLQGSLQDCDGAVFHASDVIVYPAGSVHVLSSAQGCMLLVVESTPSTGV